MRQQLRIFCARVLAWLTERLYYELAWAYDAVAWTVSLGQWATWRREALSHLGSGRVLEIGFGTGTLLLEMRARGMDAIGVDASPAMLRVTRGKARRRGVAVPAVLADARALPFASRSFASLVATFPAGCILAPDLMAEAARVLLPGVGRFVVVGLYVESTSPFLRLLAGLVNGGDVLRAASRFEAVAAAAGFTVMLSLREAHGFRLPVYVLQRLALASPVGAAAGDGQAACGDG